MGNSNKGKLFLNEFQEFLSFLKNLWGVLAGISALFPLSNVMVKVIPLAQKLDTPTLEFLSPELITAVSTLITLFVIFVTFGQRNKFQIRSDRHVLQRRAWLSFALGFFALILYLIAFFGIYGLVYEPWGIWGGDPRRLIGDFILMLSYSTFFAMVTKAFMLLGMIEFFGSEA